MILIERECVYVCMLQNNINELEHVIRRGCLLVCLWFGCFGTPFVRLVLVNYYVFFLNNSLTNICTTLCDSNHTQQEIVMSNEESN
jgi:hypothetical protein